MCSSPSRGRTARGRGCRRGVLEIALTVETEQVLSVQMLVEGGDGVRGNPVVAVQKQDIFARGMVEGGVACGAEAAVGLVDHTVGDAERGEAFAVLFGNIAAAVGGAVVDGHDLQVVAGLLQHAVEALAEVGRHIIYRYKQGKPRHVLSCGIVGNGVMGGFYAVWDFREAR